MINDKAATMELAASNLHRNNDSETTNVPPAQHEECCQQKHKYNKITLQMNMDLPFYVHVLYFFNPGSWEEKAWWP